MKRLLISYPTGLKVDYLTREQKTIFGIIFYQGVFPTPGTISYGNETYSISILNPESTIEVELPNIDKILSGESILDTVVNDEFNTDVLLQSDIPFTILGEWNWSQENNSSLITVKSLDQLFINFLPEINTYDSKGVPTETMIAPSTIYIPHNWSGWPEVIL